MLPSTPSRRPTIYETFRPVTPPEQKSIVWRLGKVPVTPNFYNVGRDEQLDARTLPHVLVTDPNLKISYIFNPFLPKPSPWYPRPRELLPAFSPRKKCSESDLSGSPSSDSTSSDELELDIFDMLWSMPTASLKHHHWEIVNGSSAYNQGEKEAVVKELARREKGAEDH
ncbi:unnamed protein product [Penicillium glandicola]